MNRGIPCYIGQFYKHKPSRIVLTDIDAIEAIKLDRARKLFRGLRPLEMIMDDYANTAMEVTDTAFNRMRQPLP